MIVRKRNILLHLSVWSNMTCSNSWKFRASDLEWGSLSNAYLYPLYPMLTFIIKTLSNAYLLEVVKSGRLMKSLLELRLCLLLRVFSYLQPIFNYIGHLIWVEEISFFTDFSYPSTVRSRSCNMTCTADAPCRDHNGIC